MENGKVLLNALIFLTPVIFGCACCILVFFSRRDCLTREERKLKSIVFAYLSLVAFGWFAMFSYYFLREEAFIILNIPMFAAYLFSAVLLFRIIRFLTRPGLPENFSSFHYVFPGLIIAVMLVWMFFVPMETLVELVKSRQTSIPGKYAVYSRFFTSKPLIRLAFQLYYFIVIIVALAGYYRKALRVGDGVRKPARWVLFLVTLLLISAFSSAVASFSPRATIFSYQWLLYSSFCASVIYVLLTYHVVRRKYLLYAVYPEKRKHLITAGGYRKYTGQITRERIETYFREQQPYLKADFRINDLMEAMDVNRTVVSSFINKTYEVNFNRYINRWRIGELKRLLSLPGNEKESAASLYPQAGFSELKQYYRATAKDKCYY